MAEWYESGMCDLCGMGRVSSWDGIDPASVRRWCGDCDSHVWRVVRFYQRGGSRTIRRALTRRQAMAWCSDPETSSSTATGSAARARTAKLGPWFDGFRADR